MIPVICLLLVSGTVFGYVPTSEFFSYGHGAKDTILHPNDDGSSPVQNISVVFEFFSEHRKQLFVNTNGLISFRNSIYTFTPEPFPKIGVRIVLAPFWADIDTRRCGSTCSIWYRESTELEDLIKATAEIRKYFPVMKYFNAKWTYIVTWFNVPSYGAHGSEFNKRNTFQAILITDSKSAFVIYNYNKIEWIASSIIPAQVGFNMGDDIHFYSVEGSRTSQIINLPNLSNVGLAGKFVFRVDLRDIRPAPTPGDPGQCLLKAADIVFVLDMSLSIDINALKNLMSDIISELPINDMECQIAIQSFSTSAKTELRFRDKKTKTEVLAHIAKMNKANGVSNLEDALSSTTQMFSFYDGPRSYAKRFVFIFTDGLMAFSRELITLADHLVRFPNMIVATVGIGSLVKHDHLELISTDINSILRPSANSIWKYLQSNLAVPGCLVDIFSEEVTEAIPLQNISGMDYKLGGLSIVEHAENSVNKSLLVQHIKDIGKTSSFTSFIIFISNGVFLDSHLIEKLKHSVNEASIIVSVGIGEDTHWDNLEDLASYGYFVFSSDDAHLLARYLKKEMKTISCT
ncbi:Hypothetical predicted protein [Mytilus galloprovincialis]|uniref:Uncharacterized protein n=1 Tax=Mytilus galloprovincialis TaxID=29158 RepID=A0A8B6GFV7_MYTGA|nr:Hypothetical predicted protein [Mytilus galloprovincialis]